MSKNAPPPEDQQDADLQDQLDQNPPPPPGMVPISAIADLGKSIGDAINAGQRRQQPFGAYDPKSSYHPDKTKVPPLKHETFQNGARCNPTTLNDAEIVLLNRITHSGRYIDRLVEVIFDDASPGQETIYINYNNKTVDQRMTNKSKWQSFGHLLQQVVDAQVAEDAEDEEFRQRRGAKGRR